MLREGLGSLADRAYAGEQERVAPGSGAVFGVRSPLLAAVARQLRKPLAEVLRRRVRCGWPSAWSPSASARSSSFSHVPLARSLPDDPERTWQLMRRLARRGRRLDQRRRRWPSSTPQGVLLERFRWAELEQLVYSPTGGSAAWSARPWPPAIRAAARPAAAAGRHTRFDAHQIAHRRRRAGRAEGAFVGAALVDRGRSSAACASSCASRRTRAPSARRRPPRVGAARRAHLARRPTRASRPTIRQTPRRRPPPRRRSHRRARRPRSRPAFAGSSSRWPTQAVGQQGVPPAAWLAARADRRVAEWLKTAGA